MKYAIKNFFISILYFLIIPNVIFWYAIIYDGISRELINIDYIFILFLPIFSNLKANKVLFFILLLVVFFIDLFLNLRQVFILEYPSDLYFLSTQAEIIPTQFIILFLLLSTYFIFLYFICFKVSITLNKDKKSTFIFSIAICLFIICNIVLKEKFNLNNKNILSSQIMNYNSYLKQKEIEGHQVNNFYYYPFHSPNYTNLMNEVKKNSQSKKILFIVAESWGYSTNQEINNDIIKKLRNNKMFSFYNMGRFNFNGFTLQGEQRSLCSNKVKGLSGEAPITGYKQCIPNILSNLGYKTISMHGSSADLYDRKSWYIRAGLKEQYFKKNFNNLPSCKTFAGKCDSDLMKIIPLKISNNEKTFFYWMTLNTHFPYEDFPENSRINCNKYGTDKDSQICRYIKSQADFFDHFATMIADKHMKGTEVFIIGDHPPRFGDLNEKKKYFLDQVSWIHLKIKS